MFPTNHIVPPSSPPLCFHRGHLISANALRSLILPADDPHLHPPTPKARPQHLHRSRQLRPSLHAPRLRIRYDGALGRRIRHHAASKRKGLPLTLQQAAVRGVGCRRCVGCLSGVRESQPSLKPQH